VALVEMAAGVLGAMLADAATVAMGVATGLAMGVAMVG